MFFDNENSGMELSAGQSSAAAAPAPDSQPANSSPEANEAVPESGTPAATSGAESPQAAPTPDPAEEAAELSVAASAPEQSAASADESAGPSAEAPSESAADMEQLMEQYAAPQQAAAEGEIETGQVVAITDMGVMVNLGGKTEGLIPVQEFADSDQPLELKPGDSVEVQRTGDRKEGCVVLSYQRVRRRRIWSKIEEAYRSKSDITGKVVDHIKGGLVVDIGVRAFLPASQADARPVRDLDHWKDRELTVRIVKLNRKRGNVVVSRRAILDEQIQSQKQAMLDSMQEGQILRGTVKNVTGYGAFVDLGGIDGLLHITDMSWGRVASPLDAVRPGEELEVKVLKFDREKMRVSLGRKQLLPDPWASVPARYATGSKHNGKIVGLTDYGAFVELEPGIEGLVHVSEMSWSKRKQHPSKIVKNGDDVEVVVLGLDPNDRRISLGMKQAQADPWLVLAEKYPVGTVVRGKIRNLTEFGAFLEIEEGFDGLIHVSDISWTGRIKDPAEAFKKGDEVEAKVLKIEAGSRRVSLGVKQVNDIWGNWFEKHKVGELVRGRVSRVTTFGAFVALAEGIEGLCHISEIEDRKHKGDRPQASSSMTRGARQSGLLDPGRDYEFKIVKIQPDQHKIGLSYRAAQKQAERRDMEDYRSSKSSATATIGDAIMAKRSM